MGSIGKGLKKGGGKTSNKKQRLMRRDERISKRKGISMKDAKKFREARHAGNKAKLARGLEWSQGGTGDSYKSTIDRTEEKKNEALGIAAEAIKAKVGGPDTMAGGGMGTTQQSEDRSDMSRNASSIYFRKKGY